MNRLGVVLAITLGLSLVVFGALIQSQTRGSTSGDTHLISMQESAQAMRQAGETMRAHGASMLAEGQRADDRSLVARGEHWVQDGDELVQRANWMAMNPTVSGSLVTAPGELRDEGNWGRLSQAVAQMPHDPRRAGSINVEALNWNGLAMRSEGRMMSEHGRVMLEDIDLMATWHSGDDWSVIDLRDAAGLLVTVGYHLEQNGQDMIDYANRVLRTLGEQ